MDDFDALYQRYLRDVYRYLYQLCQDADAAEELTQITFSIAFEKLDAFQGNSKISTWLFGIAKLEYYNWCRKRKGACQELSQEIPDTRRQPLEEIIRKEEVEEVMTIVHGLPEPYKEVFMLRTLGEMPYRNIGRLFGKGESWGRVTYYRARKMIIERMGGDRK